MSSFVDQQHCLIGQHIRNAPDSSPGSLCGGVSKRREHDALQQRLEATAGEEEGGLRRPVNLDLECGSKLERSWGRRTLRQSSYTSDLDLTPSTELSSWHDLHLAAEDRGWTDERTKQWTDPRLGIAGFQDANPSLEATLNSCGSRNKGVADGVRGGVGRGGGGRDIDVGSDSDSGKGTVSDCRQSPTEEISFPDRSIEETCKLSLCHQDVETTSDNGSVTIEASSASSMEHRKSEKILDDESDCLGEVSCLTDLQRIRNSKLMLDHYSDYDCYPVLPQSSPGMTHPERLSKVERYLAPGSPVEEQSKMNRFAADKGFSGDRIHGVPDSNNNNSFEISSPSQVDNPRCHDVVTPPCQACKVDMSHEFKGTPNRTGHCKVDDDVSDADHDLVSSRRKLQAKCEAMYGSRPSILGSQDIHSRLGSHQNVHDSRYDIHGSYRDVYPRHDAQNSYHDAYNNHDDIRDSHYDAYDVSYSCGADGCYETTSSGQFYNRGRGFQAGIQNNDHAMRGSLDGLPARHEFNHASHNSIHDSRQHCIGYNRSPSLIDSPSTISAESSFGIAPGYLNSTPAGRRYFRRESLTPSGVGAPRSSPQKGHRYTRKSNDVYCVTASESDPEIFHEEIDKAFPGSHGNITPAQYRRIRSVPHDGTPTGLMVLGSTHPALQQPFSDQEAVTLPRPAKAGRSVAASSAVEQQVNSCGKTDANGHRLRPSRRWTNLGLSSAEPEMDEFRQKTKTSATQSGARFRFPSLFKSRKDSTSAASIGTRSGTIPVTGAPVISGSTAGNDARIRSDSETGSKPRSRSGNAAESGFETGSSQSSVGDISLWSMSLGSTQSVFDSRETPLSVQGVDSGNDHFRRSISVPNPDGKVRSSASILDRIRARLSPRKKSSSSKDRLNQSDQTKSSSSKDGLAQAQNCEEIQLAVLPLFNSQVADASRGQTDRDDETDLCDESSLTTVAMTNSSMTTTFGTSTPTKSEESAIRTVNYTDTKASSPSSPATPSSSSSSAAAAAAAVPQASTTPEGFQSKMLDGRMTLKRAPPSEECLNAASQIIDALDGLTDFVNFSITSGPSTERTITEVEFKEYRSRMIDAVKDFNQACKHMVIKTPESELAFLQALHKCLQSLDDVADNYTALVDCASLPADRSKVAIPVIAVAISLRETVMVACCVTGCPSRDPVMLALRRSANRLVGDLGLLMKSVREMNYNRLSRRF